MDWFNFITILIALSTLTFGVIDTRVNHIKTQNQNDLALIIEVIRVIQK